MAVFTATIQRFGNAGEKTGWFVIVVPADIAHELQPGNRKGFRVKGSLDKHKISGVSLIPMGDGSFIIPFNAAMRKATGKSKGAMVEVKLSFDKSVYQHNADFVECLKDDPDALDFFNSLTRSHQTYFSKWIDTAKTEETKSKRIAQALIGLARKQDYSTMLRSNQKKNLF